MPVSVTQAALKHVCFVKSTQMILLFVAGGRRDVRVCVGWIETGHGCEESVGPALSGSQGEFSLLVSSFN